MWAIFKAADYTLSRSQLEAKFGALDLHFGWFCRRVAEELGDVETDSFALCNSAKDAAGEQILTLKRSVVAALDTKFGAKG